MPVLAYNKYNKYDRVRLKIFTFKSETLYYNIEIESGGLPDIAFIRQMNDSLFSQIDSIVDYHSERGLSGHMLWFNIDHKYYYCFQSEGKPLSEQVIIKKNIK